MVTHAIGEIKMFSKLNYEISTHKYVIIAVTGVLDFDVTPIRIVMEPRDTSQQDFPFTISIIPDEINEATEFFVLILRVESPSNGAVDSTSRNATRCAIVDDDREW